MCGGGEGAGKVVEQQLGALGNPCSSFSSPSSLLCIRRGFDKNLILGDAIQFLQWRTSCGARLECGADFSYSAAGVLFGSGDFQDGGHQTGMKFTPIKQMQ